jgi:hypothetical protein
VCVDEQYAWIPIFFPSQVSDSFDFGFDIREKTCGLVEPATKAMLAPFKFACVRFDPSIYVEGELAARIAMDAARARRDMEQHRRPTPFFLNNHFMHGHEHAALGAGDRRSQLIRTGDWPCYALKLEA